MSEVKACKTCIHFREGIKPESDLCEKTGYRIQHERALLSVSKCGEDYLFWSRKPRKQGVIERFYVWLLGEVE